MKEYELLAAKFIEHCKSGDYRNKNFDFEIEDIMHGTAFIGIFDSLLFVTSVYGGSSCATILDMSLIDPMKDFDNFDEDDWECLRKEAAKHFKELYCCWTLIDN